MATVTVELSEEEFRQLEEVAGSRDVDAATLVLRWVRERLVHERERAAGGGRPMPPRARRGREGSD